MKRAPRIEMRNATLLRRIIAEAWTVARNAAIGLAFFVCPVLFIASPFVLYLAWGLGYLGGHSPDSWIVTEVPSPDGAWKVVVEETVYDVGISTAAECALTLVPEREPAHRMRILTTDADICPDWGHIVWTQAKMVQVSFGNFGYPVIDSLMNDGVRVEIEFDPPDPAIPSGWHRTLERPAGRP